MSATLTGLFRYPVKSLRGHALVTSPLDFTGIRGDRGWMVVDRNGLFLTQRQCAAMATIEPHVSADGITLQHDSHGAISVSRPRAGKRVSVRIWNDSFDAFDAGDDAARWLSEILSTPARLIAFDDDYTRLCSKAWAKDSGAHTQFADGFPVLITNQQSLNALNEQMHRAIPMDRFRTNLVIDGVQAWEEDHLDTLTIGECVLKLVKPCIRCITTTTDQRTGVRLSDEPLNTLARFRNNPDLGGVTFGWNAIVLSAGELRVGDSVNFEFRF